MNGLDFGHPELWPWLLAAAPLWYGLWYLLRIRHNASRVYGAELLEVVSKPWARATRIALACLLLVLVLMDPRLGEESVEVERRGLDIVFGLDTSRSMLARDHEPSRLDAAKRDIVSVLPDLRGGDRVGLVAFSGEARVIVPLTHDLDSFRHLLVQVDTDTVRKGGTDLAAAIRRALSLIGDRERSTSVITLLTDGEDLTGAGMQMAHQAESLGVVIHAVGYGSTVGSKIILSEGGTERFLTDDNGDEVVSALESDRLRALVQRTGGEYLRSEVMALPLRQLKEKRLDVMMKRVYEAGEEVVLKARFQWLLIPAMLLLLLDMAWMGGRRR